MTDEEDCAESLSGYNNIQPNCCGDRGTTDNVVVKDLDGLQLVLSDMVVLGLNGRQTIDGIREIEPTTRVLYISGYTDAAVVRSSELGPGAGFIQKPFSGDELALRVRELLDGAAAEGLAELAHLRTRSPIASGF